MSLTFLNIEKAYKVFNIIKEFHLPNLEIHPWPEDITNMNCENILANCVYGYNCIKGDNQTMDHAWECLFFYTKKPSTILIKHFNLWKKEVAANSIYEYDEDLQMWKFGWIKQ